MQEPASAASSHLLAHRLASALSAGVELARSGCWQALPWCAEASPLLQVSKHWSSHRLLACMHVTRAARRRATRRAQRRQAGSAGRL